MKFDFKAYDELYPRPEKKKEVETAVEGFTPSAESAEQQKQESAVNAEGEVTDGGNGTDSSVSE